MSAHYHFALTLCTMQILLDSIKRILCVLCQKDDWLCGLVVSYVADNQQRNHLVPTLVLKTFAKNTRLILWIVSERE
jgi:hypothetical protein